MTVKTYKTQFILLLIVSFAACVTLLYIAYQQSIEITNKTAQIKAITDTVTLYKTKLNKNAAYRPVFVGTKKQVLAVTKQADPEVYKIIKKTKGIQSYTKLQTVTMIDTAVKIDTVQLPTATKDLYVAKKISNEYYTADVVVKDDSLSLAVKVLNDFDIMTRKKSNGFLRRKTLVVDVINKNPYTVTTGLSSFEIKPKKKRGFKVVVGVAAVVGGYLLLK